MVEDKVRKALKNVSRITQRKFQTRLRRMNVACGQGTQESVQGTAAYPLYDRVKFTYSDV